MVCMILATGMWSYSLQTDTTFQYSITVVELEVYQYYNYLTQVKVALLQYKNTPVYLFQSKGVLNLQK